MGAREIAFSVLLEYGRRGSDVSVLLDRALNDERPAAVERALATELVYGCVRRRGTLEWLIKKYARFRLPAEVRVLLSLGLYQLLYLDRVPDYAAVNETVQMVKAAGKRRLASPVNAVLRKVQSEREDLPWPSRKRGLRRYLQIRHSHPAWLVDALLGDHGPAAAEEILRENNMRPRLTIRCNTLKIGPEALMKRLEDEGIVAEPAGESRLFFNIQSNVPVPDIRSFREGLCTVQDVSAGIAVKMLDPRPGESVLDLCAGPGGKTTHVAQLAGDRGEICAIDISEEKARMIGESCERMGVRSVRCIVGDGRDARELCGGRLFDKILVDAPCSNTGVLRRRVEARWRMSPSGVGELASLQLSLLESAARCLKKGGALVYSTCSILGEEGDAVVGRFLAMGGMVLSHSLLKLAGGGSGDGVYSARLSRE